MGITRDQIGAAEPLDQSAPTLLHELLLDVSPHGPHGTPAPRHRSLAATEGAKMPTFYFDLWDGHRIEPDEQGVELRGTEAAFEMAVRAAREMLADAQLKGADHSGWAFHVKDEQGRRLFTFRFTGALPEPHYSCAWSQRRT